MLTCFDIGGTWIKPGLARTPGRVEPLAAVATPHGFEAFVARIAGAVVAGSRGVSISVAGVAAPGSGVLKVANLPAVDGRALAADLTDALGLPVWVANDADCFALAEAQSGAGKGHAVVLGIILGTGVGGGLVMGGRIVTGAGGHGGEWGHGPVVNGRLEALGLEFPLFRCGCGLTGCVDTVGGARGLEQIHRHLFKRDLACPHILADWLAGEPAARLTVEAWAEMVSGPLAMVLNVLGVSVVPVGGGLAKVPEVIARLDGAVRGKMLRGGAEPLLVPAHHRVEPGLIGAASLGFAALEALEAAGCAS